MFFGTTPQIISQFLTEEIKRQNPSKIWVLFSGNFVVEQIAGITLPNAEIHATDISLYSKAIGHGVTNTDFGLKLNPEIGERFQYLAQLKTPLELAEEVINEQQ